jgi:predicted nucleic acid-binding protein
VTSPIVVSNSSPLIALENIGRLELLERLFAMLLIPPAVVGEISPPMALPSWIIPHALTQPIGPQILGASLGPGESEAISLALEVGASWLIMDDRPARRLGQAFGLSIVGTLGVLLACKRKVLIPAVRPCVEDLMRHGFRIAPDLYQRVLAAAGETP